MSDVVVFTAFYVTAFIMYFLLLFDNAINRWFLQNVVTSIDVKGALVLQRIALALIIELVQCSWIRMKFPNLIHTGISI